MAINQNSTKGHKFNIIAQNMEQPFKVVFINHSNTKSNQHMISLAKQKLNA